MDQIVKFQEFRDVAGPFNIYYLGSANPNEVILKTSASFDDLYYGYQFSYADSPIHVRVMSLDPYLTQSSAYYYYPTTTTTTTTSTTTTTTTAEPTTTTSTTTSTTTAEPTTTTSTTTSTTTAEPTTTTSTTTTTTTEEPTTTTTSTTTTTTTAEPTTTTTTTTTTTSTTTTTTTTAPTFYDHRRSNTGNATECNVCPPSYGSGFFYTSPSDSIPTIGMTVYSDSSLTTPFNGGNLWWGIEWDGPSSSTIDGILIATDGVVDDTHICSVDCPTTTTTTTSTTTTTTTSTPFVYAATGSSQTEVCNATQNVVIYYTGTGVNICYWEDASATIAVSADYIAIGSTVWQLIGGCRDYAGDSCDAYTTTTSTTTTTTTTTCLQEPGSPAFQQCVGETLYQFRYNCDGTTYQAEPLGPCT